MPTQICYYPYANYRFCMCNTDNCNRLCNDGYEEDSGGKIHSSSTCKQISNRADNQAHSYDADDGFDLDEHIHDEYDHNHDDHQHHPHNHSHHDHHSHSASYADFRIAHPVHAARRITGIHIRQNATRNWAAAGR